jgi:hypothetical protein
LEKSLAKRNEEARESAAQFAADLEAGRLDPEQPGFNQGLFELAPLPEQPIKEKEQENKEAASDEKGLSPILLAFDTHRIIVGYVI